VQAASPPQPEPEIVAPRRRGRPPKAAGTATSSAIEPKSVPAKATAIKATASKATAVKRAAPRSKAAAATKAVATRKKKA